MKKIWKKFKKIIVLPQFITVVILLSLAFISIQASHYCYISNPFLSSIFSNIFAGLITGIAVCLISGIKQINTFRIEGKIAWLHSIHDDFLKFNKHYGEMLRMVNDPAITKEKLYDEIYDVLCEGNNINVTISQSQHNKALPFNPYHFFAKELKYDAIEHKKKNDIIREEIFNINVETITSQRLREIFKEMEHSLFILNGSIASKITELEIKQSISNRFIF
ncbi:MAG: hypothetical protein J6A58_09655 [Oscillospiraceae bacterium]|nr:hypothetical protein [Oscillospiraceae bacterium]